MRSLTFIFTVFLMLVTLMAVLAQAADATGPDLHRQVDLTLVNTTSGFVRGRYFADSKVYRYLGIPYAEDTGGSNRFKPAVRKARVGSVIDATKAGPSCPSTQGNQSRTALAFTGQQIPDPSTWSEDCLLVNLFVNQAIRQRAATKSGGAAVIIYVYGGSFMTGSPYIPIYDGVPFAAANEDTIFVTFSYRHAIFANPASPQARRYKKVGWNFGLTDMHLMLEWLRNNVASFGGDPNKIVMFGGSSGSTMVDAYGFSEYGKTNSVAKGLIIQSGAVLGMNLLLEKNDQNFERADSAWNKAARAVGCGVAGDKTQLRCMRSKSWQTIVKAVVDAGLSFTPTADEVTWFSDFDVRSALGRYARIPTIMGTNANEATLFANPDDPQGTKAADAVFTPLFWTCSASFEARDRAKAGVPTWRYIYSGRWDAFLQGRPWISTYHFSEIPQILGTTPPHWLSDASKPAPASADQLANSRLFQDMWTAFAHDPLHGLERGFGWRRYNPGMKTLAHIAKDNSAQLAFEMPPASSEVSCTATVVITTSLQKVLNTIRAVF